MGSRAALTVHPANALPFLHGVKRCAQCLYFDPVFSRCKGSKDSPNTHAETAACERFLPFGRIGRYLSTLARHPRTTAGVILGALVGQVGLVIMLAMR